MIGCSRVTGSNGLPGSGATVAAKTNTARRLPRMARRGIQRALICASKLMRRTWAASANKLSPDAALSIGKRASASAAWKERNGWSLQRLVAA